jgi:hypothetical protein
MSRDRWLILGVIGAALTCLACLTATLVLLLGAVGLGAHLIWLAAIVLLMAAQVALAAQSTVVLSVEGMT